MEQLFLHVSVVDVQVLLERYPDEFVTPSVESVMEFQWCLFVDEMKRVLLQCL